MNNTGETGDFEALRNRYTDTAGEIRHILSGNDGSEDDKIDSTATATMARPVKMKIASARDGQGGAVRHQGGHYGPVRLRLGHP